MSLSLRVDAKIKADILRAQDKQVLAGFQVLLRHYGNDLADIRSQSFSEYPPS